MRAYHCSICIANLATAQTWPHNFPNLSVIPKHLRMHVLNFNLYLLSSSLIELDRSNPGDLHQVTGASYLD